MEIGEINRLPEEQIDKISELSPSDIGHEFHFGFISPEIKFMKTSKSVDIANPVVTVRTPPEDGTMIYKAIEKSKPGDVIVIDRQGHESNACWGEITTHAAIEKGVQGVIIDGTMTDTKEIRELDFPVYARGRSTRTARLHGRGGELNVPIQCGQAVVNPGDIALGNEDGVLFVPPEKVDEALEKVGNMAEEEEEMIRQLKEGASIAEISGVNELIRENDRD